MDNTKYSYFLMWGKGSCPYCQQVQQLFFEKQLSHMIYMLDENLELLEEAKKYFNWPTVPIVVEQKGNGSQKLIGGHDEFVKFLDEIKL